ncbi:unnamed protein product, partial [Symbiodinium sp. CCMP2456]
ATVPSSWMWHSTLQTSSFGRSYVLGWRLMPWNLTSSWTASSSFWPSTSSVSPPTWSSTSTSSVSPTTWSSLLFWPSTSVSPTTWSSSMTACPWLCTLT